MLGANFQELAEATAFRAERLAARTGAKVLAFDIVARIAVAVVVVDIRQDRMPREALSHNVGSF